MVKRGLDKKDVWEMRGSEGKMCGKERFREERCVGKRGLKKKYV